MYMCMGLREHACVPTIIYVSYTTGHAYFVHIRVIQDILFLAPLSPAIQPRSTLDTAHFPERLPHSATGAFDTSSTPTPTANDGAVAEGQRVRRRK